jgi:hypothetical protein
MQPVNRKKQKRRAKAAAKAAAEQALHPQPVNGAPSPGSSVAHDQAPADADQGESDDDGEQDSGHNPHHSHDDYTTTSKSKKSKKKKKKSAGPNSQLSPTLNDRQGHVHPQAHHSSGLSKEKIWNTSSQEERERIKEFWLGLGEDERKSLVKVEKDAVLKKMKEQQKHTCSCTVCGRKRTAIEEELEGLYDAYYEELEQFANHPNHQGEGPPMMGPPRHLGPMSGLHPSRGLPSNYPHQPSHGRIVEHVGEDEEDVDEEYSDDELDEDEYSDEDPEEEQLHRPDYANDFFNFGNSLTVQGRKRLPIVLPFFFDRNPLSDLGNDVEGSSSLGGILTVADDLLKNDGKKFIEMMEQLAERRMAREEEVKEQYIRSRNFVQQQHANGAYGHNHPPPDEDEYDEDEDDYEEEDEEDYDSQEEEVQSSHISSPLSQPVATDSQPPQDTMTEEQRMEEGRRMFQIFAARMFEQRVLSAYREKVAKERQQRLIEELDEERRQDSQRKEKKAKEAQKRKDKAARKKELLAEEKQRKEAEREKEQKEREAEAERQAAEQRLKQDEKRKRREAQKKAEEDERLRKEAERQRRIHEQKEKQAELERKAREAKEREKKAREEARLQQEKEARERKELEARERKSQQERERKASQEHGRNPRTKSDRETSSKKKEDRSSAQKPGLPAMSVPITLPKRPAQHAIATALPALPQQPPSTFISPKIPVATPALPKAPTPIRPRQASQQEAGATNPSRTASQSGSTPSQNPSPLPMTPAHVSPIPINPMNKSGSFGAHQQQQQQPSQATSPPGAALKTMPLPHGSFGAPPMSMPFPPGISQMPPGLGGNRMHHEPAFHPFSSGFRAPGNMPMPPGINGLAGGRGYPHPHPPPGFSQPMDAQYGGQGFMSGPPKDNSSHSRQPSGGHELGTSAPSSQPIGRPAPIGRPSSVVHGQRPASGSPAFGRAHLDVEDHHLGSSALLDDSDVAVHDLNGPLRPSNAAPGPRMGFPPVPFGMDPNPMFNSHHLWAPAPSAQPNPFSPPPPPGFGPAPGQVPWGSPAQPSSAFNMQGGLGRPNQPRSVAIRQMLCRICKEMADAEAQSPDTRSDMCRDGYASLEAIKAQMDMQNPGEGISEHELLNMCDTEGNSSNGGGSFDVRRQAGGSVSIRWESGGGGDTYGQPLMQRPVGAGSGEVRSPKVGASPFPGRSR